jgi:hypothetical protein
MSGSPLLDSQGNVIGIHGSSDENRSTYQDFALEKCISPLPETFSGNWGIPTNAFIKFLGT